MSLFTFQSFISVSFRAFAGRAFAGQIVERHDLKGIDSGDHIIAAEHTDDVPPDNDELRMRYLEAPTVAQFNGEGAKSVAQTLADVSQIHFR